MNVLLPPSTTANWANAATCNLCHELLRRVRTYRDWWQTHPTQWKTTTILIPILFEKTSYVVKFLNHHYLYIWTALVICPLMLWFVFLCCLKQLYICHLRVHYHHLTFCRSAIVHSLQLYSIEMHSLAHFDTWFAFVDGSKIQFLMFFLTGKILHRLFKVHM